MPRSFHPLRGLRSASGTSGLITIAFGLLCIAEARRVGIGEASSMGPGFFPFVIGCLACLVGAMFLVDARKETESASVPFTFPIALVAIGFGVFALLLPTAGMIPAGAVLMILAILAIAGRIRAFDLLYVAVILTLAPLIFVEGIGLNIPLLRNPF